MSTNPYENEARFIKARKIVHVIESLEASPTWDAGLVDGSHPKLNDENDNVWDILAQLARVPFPSDATQATVRYLLDYRAELAANTPTDPFEGLN